MDFADQVKTIDICAVGPLRVSTALYNAKLLTPNSSVIAMITSQGGSIAWRPTQCPDGGDYGKYVFIVKKLDNNLYIVVRLLKLDLTTQLQSIFVLA